MVTEYFNRFVHVEFMKSTYFDGDNKLRDHCLAQLTSLPIIEAMRFRAIIHDKFTSLVRFFSSSNVFEKWDVLDMAPVMACVKDGLKLAMEQPEKFLERDYDMFALLAGVPEYAKFRSDIKEMTMKAVDGKTDIAAIEAVRDELYSPKDEDNIESTKLTREFIKVFAGGMLHTLENGQGARYVDDGDQSEKKQTNKMKVAYAYTVRNSNGIESYFGTWKHVGSVFQGISSYNANAIAGAKKDHIFFVLAQNFTDGARFDSRGLV